VVYLAVRPQQADPSTAPAIPTAPISAPAVPDVIPSVVPAPEASEKAKPIQPPVKPRARSTRRTKKVFAGIAPVPQAPAPAAILPANVTLPAVELPTNNSAPLHVETAALPPREPLTVTLPEGTLVQVRLGERLSSDRNVVGDTFFATLDQPLVVDGWVVAERGARLLGHVVEVTQAGRVEGTAQMTLELASLTTADGQKIALRTARFVRKGDTSRRDDAVKIGTGAAIGAIIGAIAGGGKGAAIGAGAGGAAGAGAVLATRGAAAALEAETRLSFRLDAPITITER
jgi:hypothetical protein